MGLHKQYTPEAVSRRSSELVSFRVSPASSSTLPCKSVARRLRLFDFSRLLAGRRRYFAISNSLRDWFPVSRGLNLIASESIPPSVCAVQRNRLVFFF